MSNAQPLSSSSTMPGPAPREDEQGSKSGASTDTTRVRTPACIVLGMAGSGKTTLVDALAAYLDNAGDLAEALSGLSVTSDTVASSRQPPSLPGDGAYVINIDPAVHELPYEPNLDIRDTVNYKQVMSEYSLGPNGAILTSLNLYATRFDQVISLVSKRAPEARAVLLDTPGQIETFTWSASGAIITDALAVTLPTVLLFVVDTPRSANPMTFVSNMLYACSVMYKTRLPLVVALNKIDIEDCKVAKAWMQDFDAFDAALRHENFAATLARSMAMALEEFYNTMRTVGVSAETGEGIPALVNAIGEAAKEYEEEYLPILEERRARREQQRREKADDEIERFRRDAKDDIGAPGAPRFREDDDDGGAMNEEGPQVVNDKHEMRLQRMKGEQSYDDEEEKEAYEDFMRYLEAVKGKK